MNVPPVEDVPPVDVITTVYDVSSVIRLVVVNVKEVPGQVAGGFVNANEPLFTETTIGSPATKVEPATEIEIVVAFVAVAVTVPTVFTETPAPPEATSQYPLAATVHFKHWNEFEVESIGQFELLMNDMVSLLEFVRYPTGVKTPLEGFT